MYLQRALSITRDLLPYRLSRKSNVITLKLGHYQNGLFQGQQVDIVRVHQLHRLTTAACDAG